MCTLYALSVTVLVCFPLSSPDCFLLHLPTFSNLIHVPSGLPVFKSRSLFYGPVPPAWLLTSYCQIFFYWFLLELFLNCLQPAQDRVTERKNKWIDQSTHLTSWNASEGKNKQMAEGHQQEGQTERPSEWHRDGWLWSYLVIRNRTGTPSCDWGKQIAL